MTITEMKAEVYDLFVKRGIAQEEVNRLSNEINQKADAIAKAGKEGKICSAGSEQQKD